MSKVQIAAFYRFFPVEAVRLEALAKTLENLGRELGLRGLLIFGEEGLNGTVCARTLIEIENYLGRAATILGVEPFRLNLSEAEQWPFRKFKVRLRDEIVTLGKPDVKPLARESGTHLSPSDWDQAIECGALVLDTRNWYETKIGKFKSAVDPKLEEFAEFSGYLEKAELPKEKDILIYCTGGIRCEKALVEMKNQGFQNVYQLDGGILNYLAQKPNQNFEGECFVFDTRVAVDQELAPTTVYKMCPHCGQPALEKIDCIRCDSVAIVCGQCAATPEGQTCSKNCAHHWALSPGKKGRSQKLGQLRNAVVAVKP